ncbi:hypothetical protein EV363DRAFT_1358612 [Boletus edulis]|nr:hypothetical protein EV363DRAFT_1358612 [Boletus edulis]
MMQSFSMCLILLMDMRTSYLCDFTDRPRVSEGESTLQGLISSVVPEKHCTGGLTPLTGCAKWVLGICAVVSPRLNIHAHRRPTVMI